MVVPSARALVLNPSSAATMDVQVKSWTLGADFLNVVYFRRGLTCTLGLTNDLIDGGQPRAKPLLRKVKPNHVLKTVFSPRLATVYEVVGYPDSTGTLDLV